MCGTSPINLTQNLYTRYKQKIIRNIKSQIKFSPFLCIWYRVMYTLDLTIDDINNNNLPKWPSYEWISTPVAKAHDLSPSIRLISSKYCLPFKPRLKSDNASYSFPSLIGNIITLNLCNLRLGIFDNCQ